jgi:hypothetical protein
VQKWKERRILRFWAQESRKNRVLDRKIWAFEALWAKWPFQEILGAYLEFLEWLEGLGVKDKGLCKIWELFKGCCEILEGFGPICN